MSVMIQIRNVSAETHRTLKSRAALEGMSLSDYLKRELERVAARPTLCEWLAWNAQTTPVPSRLSSAAVIRELRDSR